ncbi:MAG: gliding motility-associated C-terminal domain-containing protein [Bacteroidetes bacterium]|nr:gliding motility-associated C-terminal domain-containing protein [Bacteroidota bacterium]
MRRLLLLTVFITGIYFSGFTQNLSFTCPRDTVLGCNATCFSLTAQFPDIRNSSADYYVGNVTPQSTCRPYIPPGAPGTSANLSIDDKYSTSETIPFGFSFYGRVYNNLVISTNGYISFSTAYANQFSHYGILNSGTGLSASTGTPVALPSSLIDSLVIMGPYHDIQPGVTTSPTQHIVFNTYGTAPNRKWILSYYKIPLFNCNNMIENTHQIILHENTGVIEVFMGSRQNCTTWNEGRALIGIQNGNRTKGKMAPGRTAADGTWGALNMNETWRFVPNSGVPLYRSVELLDASGTVVATGDTTRINAGTFETTFANVCPPAGNSLYVVKTTYESIVTPGTFIYSLDTVNVLRTPNLPVDATATATACGMSSGSITVTVAGGVGPYTYSIDGGPTQASNVFTNLAAGPHTVTATDAGGCTNTLTVTVTAVSSLTSTETHTNASCPGINNGSITITPTAGSTPYQYSLNGGTAQASNVFSNLAGGNYTITFTDVNGCTGTKSVTITTGSAITSTSSFTNTSCNGASDGTLTVTGTSGNAPYQYSLNGGTNQASGTFTGLVAGNYTVTITDANGCTGTKIVTINNGAAGLTMTVSVLPTGCPGASNGQVTVTPTSGVAPYTFSVDGSLFQVSPTLTGLSQGNHMVTIKDANGCTGTRVVGIGAGAALQSTIVVTPASCAGNDGSITLTPTTGTGPYTYSIDGGTNFQASNTFTNLATGSYTITFQDAIGCSGTKTGTITSSTGITGTASATQTTCPGASNATITATPVTGTAPFTYSLNGGTFQASNIFNNVAAGTHTITFKDNTGCTGTADVIVTDGPAITGSASSTATTCLGASDGTVTVTPAIAGTYTYTLDGGPSQASNIFNLVAVGNHTVTFQDLAGCIGTTTVDVAAGPQVTATSTTIPASCPGATNGSITVTTSIAGTYAYTIDGGTPQASSTFNNVTSGTHTITFQNTLGCSGSLDVTVSAGAALTGTATPSATSCSGVNDGTITVTPSVASAYTYTLNPGGIVQNNNNLFTGLAPGTYDVQFQDNSTGCQGTVTNITITAGAALTGTAVATATSCPTVNDGTITITPGGTGPYTFTLNPGAVSQASNIFTNLAPGTYTIDFTTASGCVGTVAGSFTVAEGPYRTSTTTLDQPDCANINDGIITINPGAEATTPYASFTLTGPGGATSQNGNTFSNLAPGNYTYNFTDAIGCTGSGTAVLTTHSPLATTVSLTMPLCNGNANGIIALNASGGGAPYQYALAPFTSYQSNGTFNTTSGTYTIRIKDTYGCTKDTTVILNQPPVLTASAVSNTPAGCDGNNGTVTITAAGGTPAYQYSLDGTTFQAADNFVTPTPGTFANITVKDNNGCTATASATVQLIDNMFLSIGNDTTICAESRLTFSPQTNAGTNIFQWRPLNAAITPPSTIIDPIIKNATVAPLDTATYVLHAEWGACVREDTVLVRVLHKPIADAGRDTAICDLSSAVVSGSATNLSGTVNFAWSPAEYATTPNQETTVVTPPKTQVFTLTVTDNYGCNFLVTDQVVVVVQPPVPAFAGRDTIAAIGQPHQLFGSGGVSFEWSPAAPLNLSTAQNPIAILNHDQQFVLKVTDYAGCIGYDTVFIQVYKDSGYYIPNAFSPNGDGLNDVFIPTPVNMVKTNYFKVYNRLGQMVFETNEWRKGWDGRYLGKIQPIGAYVWVIQGIDKAGKTIQMKGTVLLVR